MTDYALKNQSKGYLRARDVAAYLGIGLNTVWRWARIGRLPKGQQLSPRCTVWKMSELQDFLERAGKGAV